MYFINFEKKKTIEKLKGKTNNLVKLIICLFVQFSWLL